MCYSSISFPTLKQKPHLWHLKYFYYINTIKQKATPKFRPHKSFTQYQYTNIYIYTYSIIYRAKATHNLAVRFKVICFYSNCNSLIFIYIFKKFYHATADKTQRRRNIERERDPKNKNTFPRDQDHSAAKRQLVADVCTEQHINLKLPIANTYIFAIFADLVIFRTAVPKEKKKPTKIVYHFFARVLFMFKQKQKSKKKNQFVVLRREIAWYVNKIGVIA